MDAPTNAPKEANLRAPWKKGESGNPSGKKKGQRSYATIYRLALEKIAATKGMTPDQVEEFMEQVGLDKAMEGDYKFFQDIRDRIHGKPKQGVELSGPNGEDIPVIVTVKYE